MIKYSSRENIPLSPRQTIDETGIDPEDGFQEESLLI